jgi:hypothetical protein
MKKLVTGMLVSSVALAMLVGTKSAYAHEAPDATYGRPTVIAGQPRLR